MSDSKKHKKKEIMIEDEKAEEKNEEIKEDQIEEEKEESKSEEKITQLENEVAELKDKLLRKAAEFENYKRRTENDQLNLLTYAAESFIQRLLPVVDDFERSLQHINEAQEVDAIKQGLKLIYDKFMKVLDDQGVKKMESVGEPFNVDYHEALLQRPDDSVEPHTVLEEIEKGYMYKDKVIRHAKVIVSEDKEPEVNNNSENDESSEEEKDS
ncbi:nucleotide exchange factor GrpE [bacterium BMS3Abin03]|jgi:molecular chaperone GrpE|nr:nucleotide exchange factor GrpE [bacterium BMS3Abin03]MCG6961158.1 nucleotide exchange factor GrpE [bacterium BMS3Abin03]